MSALWAWFLDALLGPRCGMDGCGYRACCTPTLALHLWTHAGEVEL